ncbi:GNAT family N-acetyltransferase [Roseobacter sinensis]|uniref:N-acetyltransferase domain-containing protein n=1 Tax=Roseobacter sinensis TaxID=2931391 RepID=A0ABT3BJ88_9RHOB|nr:hypothetical protein [Roseobacter sp. WL0113]MCV3273640.1 hypothetical protein [Roseobacter sp. WL0113]
MRIAIRAAKVADVDKMVPLLVDDGRLREQQNPILWKLAEDAPAKVSATLTAAMEQERPAVRQKWLLAECEGRVVGLTHSILLPVPPIYAGVFGPPGLIMEDCALPRDAPSGTATALLEAAETDLQQAGAQILLASSVPLGAWEDVYIGQGYAPLTLYYAKSGLEMTEAQPGTRPATDADVPGMVTLSAENRQLLFDLDAFWAPHAEADARFGTWMKKSLTLPDRDMFVADAEQGVAGYVISQPATPLHFPAPHDISCIGVIDDFYHAGFSDRTALDAHGIGARALLTRAEAALRTRGNAAAMVVCPAAWSSKIALLEDAGYRTAITWFKKR